MCGINGLFAHARGRVSREELLATRDHMFARGPDGAGAWFSPDGRVALGHRRLAIIDLSEAGAQPMSTPDGRYTIVFNGEIYNHAELRAELEAKGERFVSHSDTEVLLRLYAREGAAMLPRLRGMFAFAVWDALEQRLFLARDPHGIKPLYWSDSGGVLRFASQVQALLAGGALARQVSPGGLVGFLLWGSVPEPFTFYQGIRELPAGSSLSVAASGCGKPESFWRLGTALASSLLAAREIPVGEEVSVLRAALVGSVRAHLVADVPVGAFLSAGLDSSTLVGLAREAGLDIQTFTVTAEELRGKLSDEAPHAAEIARHFDVPHQVASLTLEQAHEGVPAFLAAMDQPTVDGINTWFVTEATRQAGLKVALSGLGGDELLGGYPSFQRIPAVRANAGSLTARPPMAAAYRQGQALLARLFQDRPARAGEAWAAAASPQAAYLWQRGLFMPWELSRLLRTDIVWAGLAELAAGDTWEACPPELNEFGQVSLLESTRYMRNQLLRDSDWVGMAHSLELRTPLVDQHLSEQVAGLAALGRLGQGKSALAATLARGLPEHILNRPKTGFTLPIWAWLHKVDELAGWKRNPWLRRSATDVYARWGYSVIARLPEVKELLA